MSTSSSSSDPVHPLRVFLKGLLLFALFNLYFAAWNPSGLGKISAYNYLFPGRERFPFGENPALAYNLSLYDLDAMFASHVIAGGPKSPDEYRVILIGDSSAWGILLKPEETLSGQLNDANLIGCDGRRIHVYNLGYPTISLTKDLMVLDQAVRYEPDLILWPLTLEAFPADRQLTSPIVAHNAPRVRALIEKYGLNFDSNDPALIWPTFSDRTIIGQRRNLAAFFRLQIYGALWASTGIDQIYPADYPRAQTDFEEDIAFHDWQPPTLNASQLSFDVLEAGVHAAGNIPIMIINEPMLISSGKNSHLRYNFFYPLWAYDQYRQMMGDYAQQNGWNYLDLWNIVPAAEFTNSAIHMTPAGEAVLVARVGAAILEWSCP